MNRSSVIVDAVRSPIGVKKGRLIGIRADDLATQVVKALLERQPGLPAESVEDLVLGCAFPEHTQSRWEIVDIEHDGARSFVEAIPTPNDIGPASLKFLLEVQNGWETKVIAVYGAEKGGFTLLFKDRGYAGEVPETA